MGFKAMTNNGGLTWQTKWFDTDKVLDVQDLNVLQFKDLTR